MLSRHGLHTLLFEGSLAGHGFEYIRLQVPAFLKYGRVTLCTKAESLQNPVFRSFAQQYQPQGFSLDASIGKYPPSGWGNLWYGYINLVRALRKHNPDILFLTGGGNFLKAFSLFRYHWRRVLPEGCRVEVILHQVNSAYSADSVMRKIKNRAEIVLMDDGSVDRIHVCDALAYDHLKGQRTIPPTVLNMLPDPVQVFPVLTSSQTALLRERLGLPRDSRIIGCAGVVDERKGIALFLDAFTHAPLDKTDQVLLAGQMSPSIRNLVGSLYAEWVRQKRIVCIDRFLTIDELNMYLQAMDVVCIPYPQHKGISSILLRAAACRRPVLSSNYGWPGWITEQYKLGVTCNVRDCLEFSRAIVQVLDWAEDYRQNEEVERLLRFHDWQNFCAHITQGARLMLGLEPQPIITWEMVTGQIQENTRPF
jgi:glycosyltransferase involved in cell wall biosynthesis